MVQYRELVQEFLIEYLNDTLRNENVQNNLRIKKVLIDRIPTRMSYTDSVMIHRFFKNPKQQIYI